MPRPIRKRKELCLYCQRAQSEGLQLSKSSVWGILRAYRYHKTKPTRKPGLTKKMRQQRLDWCMAHKDWTLDDWKNFIWSDETSVILLHRRGGYRVWRRSYGAVLAKLYPVRDGKGHVSLCSGDVFPMKRKALPTVGVLRLLWEEES